MSKNVKPTRRRVVIGLNAVSGTEHSVAAAATLAAAIEAEMVGIFRRHDALLDAAEFPFARVFQSGSPAPQPVSRRAMERAIARREGLCRKAMSVRAEHLRVQWSFRSAPEDPETPLSAELLEGDLLVLPQTEGRAGVPTRFDRTVREAEQRAAGIVFAESGTPGGPVVAIDDGDAIGGETVRLAARIADVTGADLEVLVIAATPAEADMLAGRARQAVHRGTALNVQHLPPGAVATVANALHRLAPSFVVGDLHGDPFGDESAVRALLRAARAPVVLLRDPSKKS